MFGATFGTSARYPTAYRFFAAAAAADAALTGVVLALGGREVNPIAAWILNVSGFTGMVSFKAIIVCFVVAVCQVVGGVRLVTGLRLAWLAAAIHLLPVSAAGFELSAYAANRGATERAGEASHRVEAVWNPQVSRPRHPSGAPCSSRTITSGTSLRQRLMSW